MFRAGLARCAAEPKRVRKVYSSAPYSPAGNVPCGAPVAAAAARRRAPWLLAPGFLFLALGLRRLAPRPTPFDHGRADDSALIEHVERAPRENELAEGVRRRHNGGDHEITSSAYFRPPRRNDDWITPAIERSAITTGSWNANPKHVGGGMTSS